MSGNGKSPAAAAGKDTAEEAGAEAMRICAGRLLDAAVAEPVPERMRSLALALEQALEERRRLSDAAAGTQPPRTGAEG